MAFEELRPVLAAEEFRLISELLLGACGLQLRDDLKYVVERRLWPRLEALSLRDYGAYHRYLRFDARAREELELAIELLVPHETYFFREPAQLDSFSRELLPMLKAENESSRRLRVWSAGCSSGEEPYTLAMLISDSGLFDGWDVQIHGTDISRRMLAAARVAEYGQSALRTTTPSQLARHFDAVAPGRYRVKAELKNRVSFGHLNLLDQPGLRLLPRMDAIFCRNVLIYFEPVVRRRVVHTFWEQLLAGGYLLLGHSESLLTYSTDFALVQLTGDLVYRRPGSA
jgi:chemotaxis protein methyltransferase CheR